MTANHDWLVRHVTRLRASFDRLTGQCLIPPALDAQAAVTALDHAEFALASHGTEPDPVFNYANRLALARFEMRWEAFITLPSRLASEPEHQAECARLLAEVSRQGYIADYSGIRIARSGQCFRIHDTTVWNVSDERGQPAGQAALIRHWKYL